MNLSGLQIVLIVNHQITELVWAFMRSLDFSSYWIAMRGFNKVSPVEFDTLVEMTHVVMDLSLIVMTVLSGMLVKSFAARTALQVSVVVTTAGFVGSLEGGPAHG